MTEQGPEPAREKVSKGHLVVLAVLLVILVGLIVATVIINARTQRLRQQRLARVREAVETLRSSVKALAPGEPAQRIREALGKGRAAYATVMMLDPENAEARALAVALLYASGQVAAGVREFNQLDAEGLYQTLPNYLRNAVQTLLAPFPSLAVQAVDYRIQKAYEAYLGNCATLWHLALSATEGCSDEPQKAVALCRWFALHTVPDESASEAAPYLTVMRGRGTPAQLAWAYAELARQLGLTVRVLPGPAESDGNPLVVVFAEDGSSVLVDPVRAVPLMDADSGQLLDLATLQQDPGAYGRTLARAGAEEGNQNPAVGSEPLLPLHPFALYRCFVVLNHLLDELPAHPVVALYGKDLTPEGQPKLWDFTVETFRRMSAPQVQEAARREVAALELIFTGRSLQMQGMDRQAHAALAAAARGLQDRISKAEVQEGLEALQQALEMARFFAAVAALDAGDPEAARSAAEQYLTHHPDGAWAVAAKAVLAEAQAAAGDLAQARVLWAQLPPPRRVYGLLRSKGLLGPAAPPAEAQTQATPAPAPAPSSQ